jgi:hypothetical protein
MALFSAAQSTKPPIPEVNRRMGRAGVARLAVSLVVVVSLIALLAGGRGPKGKEKYCSHNIYFYTSKSS